jgi:hypothetical protein
VQRKGEKLTTTRHEKDAQAAFAFLFKTLKGQKGRTNVRYAPFGQDLRPPSAGITSDNDHILPSLNQTIYRFRPLSERRERDECSGQSHKRRREDDTFQDASLVG